MVYAKTDRSVRREISNENRPSGIARTSFGRLPSDIKDADPLDDMERRVVMLSRTWDLNPISAPVGRAPIDPLPAYRDWQDDPECL
jgi:hypothetical protein